MNTKALTRVVHTSILLLFFSQSVFSQSTNINSEELSSEELWTKIDFISIKKALQIETGYSNIDIDLYMKYLELKFPEERSAFFRKADRQEITQQNLQTYTNTLLQKYINTTAEYKTIKNEFLIQQNQNIYKPLSFNGPCENIDFESGTTEGWSGSIGTACERQIPCDIVNGFTTTRHEIMTTTMVDPYIPTLPVVAPGGNFSMRLENYVNGGNAAIIRQTFLVTPSNNIFTYQYAAVLEDPGDHRDAERPFFKVRMYDKNGNAINCATYTAIAKPPIQNFTYSRVLNPNFDPTSQNGGGNNLFLDLYYRDWTTITIPLLGYIGQNVTVEFIASDCSRGGHLGYAYIDATCSYLETQIPPTICGAENIDLYGPKDFAKYFWTGPGIIGSPTTQNIQVNKSGLYKLELTPVADKPCPITVQTTVPERCLPVPINTQACETVKGSETKLNVDLTRYNTTITAYNNLARVYEWHSGLPATNVNKIPDPTNINVRNGNKYYAVINYTTAGSDTAELKFKINSLPNLTFDDINPLCKSNTSVNISGVSPTGGFFSGTNITTSGIFSPIETGTVPITYKYTTTNGCSDSIKKSIVVNPPPTVNLVTTQKLCATATTVNLTATATNQTNIRWSGGLGTFLNNQDLTTEYSPTQAEKKSGSVTINLNVTGISPCPAISQNVVINFIQIPTVNAGLDKDICKPITSTIQLQGNSTNTQINSWSGGDGVISNINSLQPTYQPTLSEIESGIIEFTLTATGNTPCEQVQDQLQIRFHESPVADAGEDKIVCVGIRVPITTSTSPNIIYKWESLYHTPISAAPTTTIIADKDSTLILKLENQFGCIDSDTVNIDAFTPPTFNLGGPYCFSNELLLNSKLLFTDQLSEKPTWSKDGIIIVNANTPTIKVKQEGRYTISYKQGECEVSANTEVFKNPILITPNRLTDCVQNTVTLTTSNTPLSTYSWKKNNITIAGNTNSISTLVENATDKYNIEVTNQHNCVAKDSIEVVGIPRPILQLTDASICEGTTLQIDGTPKNMDDLSNYQLSYKWYLNNVQIENNIKSIAVSTAGSYKLIADVNTCTDTTSMYLTINPAPIINLPRQKKICPESDPDIILDAGNHSSYIWSPVNETSQKINVNTGGFYSVIVYNSFNCSASGTTEIKETCPPRLFVANAFSPNQDGTNDLFNVYGAHIGKYTLLIFNRWGEVIFESKNKDNFWDGVYKGEMMPIGVYPWIITYEGDSNEYIGPYKLEGSVTLVK